MHHLNYDNIGHETINDVACLCKGHHLDVHKRRLIVWLFTEEEMKHFKTIAEVICSDPGVSYLAMTKRERRDYKIVSIDDKTQ